MKKSIGLGFFVALTLFCFPAVAQLLNGPVGAGGRAGLRAENLLVDPNTYGTQAETAHTIFNQDFNINLPTTTWDSASASWLRYITNASGCCFEAPLYLPEGASITALELEGCDNSTTGELYGVIAICPIPGGSCSVLGSNTTSGVSAAPGCNVFRANFTSPATINNAANTYFVQVNNQGDLTGAVTFRAARVYYKLQVSPPPATPTFGDVPTTHLFYQYIEALAASGITAGCGGGNYCPDAAVTRGQMAVFLAKALGLHWAP